MKTTLTILIAGFIFLTTPLIASAHGKNHHRDQRSHRVWVAEKNHHSSYDRPKHQRVKKQLRREVRQTRRDLRQFKRQIRHARRHHQPYYAKPGVVVGFPHVVFRFDW